MHPCFAAMAKKISSSRMRPAGEAEEEAPALPATKKMKKAGAQGEEPKESSEATMLMKRAGLTASGSSEASSSAAAPAQPGQPSNVVRLTEQEIAEDKDVVHSPIDSEEVRPPIVAYEPVFTPEAPERFETADDDGDESHERELSSSSPDNPLVTELNNRDARLGRTPSGPTFVSPALMQALAAAPMFAAPVHQPVPDGEAALPTDGEASAVPHDGEAALPTEDTQEWIGPAEVIFEAALPGQAIEAGSEAEATLPCSRGE